MSQRPDISGLDAIVLAGGDSRRMGSPKATLPFGGTTLAGAVVAALQPVFRQVLVVTWEPASLSDGLSGFDVEILEDGRIGRSHWQVPGHDGKLGFGGSCFPKDLNGFMHFAKSIGVDPTVSEAVWKKNLEVRPEKDWEELKGRAVSEEDK